MNTLKEAFSLAVEVHHSEKKSGTEILFLYHPLAVASLVLKYGGNLEQTQAALLHDTIFDSRSSEADLAARFGKETARLAYAFNDPEMSSEAKADWRKKREAYLNKLKTLDEEALLVVGCEEFHELSELVSDLRYIGVDVWKRYPVPSMELGWYFREILSVLNRGIQRPVAKRLVSDFAAVLRVLQDAVFEGQGPCARPRGIRSTNFSPVITRAPARVARGFLNPIPSKSWKRRRSFVGSGKNKACPNRTYRASPPEKSPWVVCGKGWISPAPEESSAFTAWTVRLSFPSKAARR
jgi:GTP pyrophosphokinase